MFALDEQRTTPRCGDTATGTRCESDAVVMIFNGDTGYTCCLDHAHDRATAIRSATESWCDRWEWIGCHVCGGGGSMRLVIDDETMSWLGSARVCSSPECLGWYACGWDDLVGTNAKGGE